MPVLRIERPEVGDKVILQERPALAGFGTANLSIFHPASQFFLAELEEVGSLLKVQSANGTGNQSCSRQTISRTHQGSSSKHRNLLLVIQVSGQLGIDPDPFLALGLVRIAVQ